MIVGFTPANQSQSVLLPYFSGVDHFSEAYKQEAVAKAKASGNIRFC